MYHYPHRHIAASAVACVLLLPATSRAQQPSASDPNQPGHLVVERIHDGPAVAPDVRFTEINHDFATLVGVYGGWVVERTLLIGAGGYWLVNGSNGQEMAYGGPVVEWLFRGDQHFGYGVRSLVGGGTATLTGTFADLVSHDGRYGDRVHVDPRDSRNQVPGNSRVRAETDFFIAEPQGTVFFRANKWLRIDAGVGYRLIGAANGLDDHLRGVSGSVSVQIGGGS